MSEGPSVPTPGGEFDVPWLVAQLTVAEKVSLCLGSDFWHTASVERLGIPKIMVSDGPHGLRAQLEEADHLGLSGSVPATCFPTASALASSWNVALCREVGEALAREAQRWGSCHEADNPSLLPGASARRERKRA